jgi:hypothetical protein
LFRSHATFSHEIDEKNYASIFSICKSRREIERRGNAQGDETFNFETRSTGAKFGACAACA